MERFDEMLRAMADKEECIVPEGFDGRLQRTLDGLPPKTAKRGPGAAKGVLIAAAACALLIGSAFAASPTLRELIGSFAPYAQEQEDRAYTMDGFQLSLIHI